MSASAALSLHLVILTRVPATQPELDTLALWTRRLKAD